MSLTVSRIVAGTLGLLIGAASALACYVQAASGGMVFVIPAVLFALALSASWYALVGAQVLAPIGWCLLAGLVTGAAVAPLVGAAAAVIFYPGNNLAPLLGAFIVGPAGFLLGCIGGIVWFEFRRRRPA